MSKTCLKKEEEKKLLEKNLNDFYLVVIEKRDNILTECEYKELKDRCIYTDKDEEVEELFRKIQLNERIKKYKDDIKRIIFSFAQIRHLGVVTIIDNQVYDIANLKFVDLQREKIISFENLTTIYNEDNARLKYCTKEDEPQLEEATVLLDVDDENIILNYEKEHVRQKESNDLTSKFLKEVNGYTYTLKK
jgi:hypothetical protein